MVNPINNTIAPAIAHTEWNQIKENIVTIHPKLQPKIIVVTIDLNSSRLFLCNFWSFEMHIPAKTPNKKSSKFNGRILVIV